MRRAFHLARRPAGLSLLCGCFLLVFSTVAVAELTRDGDVVASFVGGLTPKSLPRDRAVPVIVRVAGRIKALRGTQLPQLRKIFVAINKAGQLDDKGLPACRVASIQPATEDAAKRQCARSIIGDGEVTLVVRLPSQDPYVSRNRLLAFNGPSRHGVKLILAQVYSINPPGSIILTFKVRKHRGLYGHVIETELPSYAQGWAYLTRFELNLGRIFKVHGKRHSYVSASCAAPAGFPGALFPFGKATYVFGSGQVLTTKISRTCKVAGD
jgi:hypothetical protein